MNVDAFKFLSPRLWPDLFEILIVTFVIYRFLLFLVGTRALQIVIGLVILSLTYFVAVFGNDSTGAVASSSPASSIEVCVGDEKTVRGS